MLAALAATSISCGALAAPVAPLDALPPEFSIAIRSIQQELDRRTEVPPKQPLRLDQPSAVAPTPAQKAALRAVFGTEQPMTVQRTGPAGNNTHYAFSLPAGQYQLDDTRIAWAALPLRIGVLGNTVSTDGKWPLLEFHGLDYNAVFRDFGISSSYQRNSRLGNMRFDIGSVSIDDLTPEGSVQAEGISYRQSLVQQNKTQALQYEFSGKRIVIAEHIAIDDLHLALLLRGLKQERWRELAAAEMPLDLLKSLAAQGARMELTDFSAVMAGGKLRVSGVVGTAGATPADLDSTEAILNALDVRLNVEIATSALRAITVHFARQNHKGQNQQAIEKAAQDYYAFAIGKLISEGYATLEKDKLVSTITIRQGKLRVHEHATEFPLLDLLKMLDQQNAPSAPAEQDHSPPVAVLWRDRSLEHLQLYAGNGDRHAIRELCHRYALANDAEQSARWCTQAQIDPANIKEDDLESAPKLQDNTLFRSLKGGYYDIDYFRLDPAKLRRLSIRMENPQQHDEWVPSMSVCVRATAPSDAACLELIKYSTSEGLRLQSTLRSADGKTSSEPKVLDHRPKYGEPVTVDILVDDHQVHFWIGDNDENELVEPVTFPASILSLSCSTGDCRVTFE